MSSNQEALADIEAIKSLKARYFRLLDQKRWDKWRDVFTPEVSISTPDDTGDATPIVGRDVFVDGLKAILEAVPTAHQGHMPEITVDGDTASGVWAMEDHLFWPPESGLGHMWGLGWYEETYERCDDGAWRIATMHLRRIRSEAAGNQIFPRNS